MDIDAKIEIINKNLPTALEMMRECSICPRKCGIDRLAGDKGFCRLGKELMVSSVALHHGEEPPISGHGGSGTVFLTGCNLRCIFCQNYPISHLLQGSTVSAKELAEGMIDLWNKGAHNINFVTPTHLGPLIMESLLIAYKSGLGVPVVYNCGGYESVEMLKLWEGVVDIYMPDMKYGDNSSAEKYSSAPDYVEVNRAAIIEMQRQVGVLDIDKEGIAQKGLLIRHLVLPDNLANTEKIMQFIAEKVSRETYISLMSQYFSDYKASDFPELKRRIEPSEYLAAKRVMNKCGLANGWHQNIAIDESDFSIRNYL